MSRSTFTVRPLGASATLLLAAACGNSAATTAAHDAGTSAIKSAPGGVLGVATTSLAPVLVDSKGFTVCMLTADSPGHSTCSAQCLQYWPLVPAPAGSGVPPVQGVGAALAATKATSGASMVKAGGWPLYTFVRTRPLAMPRVRASKPLSGPGMPCRHPASPSPRPPRPLRPPVAAVRAVGAATATGLGSESQWGWQRGIVGQLSTHDPSL